MTVRGPLGLAPLGILFVLHGLAIIQALQYLATTPLPRPDAYVPWLIAVGFAVGTLLTVLKIRTVPRILILVVWACLVQLILLPPGFSPTFRVIASAPVLVMTVLQLRSFLGPSLALGELAFFLAGQGARTAWGVPIAAASWETLWGLGSIGFVLIGGAWVLGSALQRLRLAEREVSLLTESVQQIVQANVGFQELATAVEKTSMRQERLRITREIHDIVGYTLTNQTMVLQAITVLLEKGRDREKLRELLFSAEEAARLGLQDVRQALRQLRREADNPEAFLNRVHQLCRMFEQATRVKVELSGAQTPHHLSPSLELVIYRLVQEGLTNAFLHGRATRISVGLALAEEDLVLHLADNGHGADDVSEGIGLAGMRERLLPFGGKLGYEAGSHGFTIWAKIPRSRLQEDP